MEINWMDFTIAIAIIIGVAGCEIKDVAYYNKCLQVVPDYRQCEYYRHYGSE